MAVRVLGSASLPLTGNMSLATLSWRMCIDNCLLRTIRRGAAPCTDSRLRHTRCNNIPTLSVIGSVQSSYYVSLSRPNRPCDSRKLLCLSGSMVTVSVRGMAGHSHWANIKHTKALTDKAKSDVFIKMAYKIKVAIKEGGSPDPLKNSRLQTVLAAARAKNVPKSTIDKILQRAAMSAEPFFLEIQGPEGSYIIAEVESQSRQQGKSSVNGSVKKCGMTSEFLNRCRHMFTELGVISVETTKAMRPVDMDKYLEVAIETGAEDVIVVEEETEDGLQPVLKFHCEPKSLQAVKKEIENCDLDVSSAQIEFHPKLYVNVSEAGMEVLEKAYLRLNVNEMVLRTYDNISLPDE